MSDAALKCKCELVSHKAVQWLGSPCELGAQGVFHVANEVITKACRVSSINSPRILYPTHTLLSMKSTAKYNHDIS